MSHYPAPAGPPPDFDGGEGYPTHNPYAGGGGGGYAMRAPPPPVFAEARPGFFKRGRGRGRGRGSGGLFGGGGGGQHTEMSRLDSLARRAPLRGIVMVTAFFSALYLFIVGSYTCFRQLASSSEPGKLKVFDAIEGTLYTVAGAIEVFGLIAAAKSAYQLARLYSFASCVSLGCTLAAELLGIIVHFSNKDLIIDTCTTRNTGRYRPSYADGWWGSSDYDVDRPMDAAAARDWCTKTYKRQSPWSIVLLLATAFLGFILVTLSFAFVRQLMDPRATRVAPSAQYASAGAGGMGPSGGGGGMPELRYDAYPMGAPAGGRRSTDSDYAWDARADPSDSKLDAHDYDDDEYDPAAPYKTTSAARTRGADGDASTLVGDGEADRKAKFGHEDDDDDDEFAGSNSRPGSSKGVRPADNPV
ncbi:hypothetical protein OC835_002004 [Tilletia horrida]|nr:hypothetical protein OC835_002004 [Tilletia horrida]